MPNPLGEVFGFPPDNFSQIAKTGRSDKLCRFNNKVDRCTKDKKNNPLGVCSMLDASGETVITCPTRFREDWLIAQHAAAFFFPATSKWTKLPEVRLNNELGDSAGNIDVVLVSCDEHGNVIDFGSLEIQGVYISGNIRNPFKDYMKNPGMKAGIDWKGKNYPRADYLSSSRKRLVPQMLYKGGIFHVWGKKQAVALHKAFFAKLPPFTEVKKENAEIAWLIYDLKLDQTKNEYKLVLEKTVYSDFESTLRKIIKPLPGKAEDFVAVLQKKLEKKLKAQAS
jgi:hypothetical protein